MMKHFSRYFFSGLLFLGPVVLTFYIVSYIFLRIDRLFPFDIPGAGFITTLALIVLVGFLSSHFLTRRLMIWADGIFARLPLVKMIYTSIKDLIDAFVGDKKRFNRPVSVLLENGVRFIGFITREEMDAFGIEDSVAVYLPQSYNFAGNLLIVERSRVTPIPAESSDVMTFLVSGGLSSSQHKSGTSA